MRRISGLVLAGAVLTLPATAADRPDLPFGRLIVMGSQQAWLVPARGRIIHLAGAEAVSWSPALRLLAVTSRDRLAVRPPGGKTLWARRYEQLAGAPRWSSGAPVRLAFFAGRTIRLVDRHGAHERRLGRARDVAPAWRPGRDELAFVRPDGDVVLVAGTGRLLARWHSWRVPAGLSWTGDGRHLVVSLRYSVAVLGADLEPEWTRHTESLLSAVAAPAGAAFGLLTVRAKADGSQVTTLELRDADRPARRTVLARTYVMLGRIVWSPDGRLVMVERPLRRGWTLIDVSTHRARALELPRSLRPVYGGAVGWYR